MDFHVKLFSSSTNFLPFKLRLTQCNFDVRMEYLDTSDIPFITDYLHNFSAVKMNDRDPLSLTIDGVVPRTISFEDEVSVSNFCTYLKQVSKLELSPDNDHSFLLKQRDSEQQPKLSRRNYDSLPLSSYPASSFDFADAISSDFFWQKPVRIAPKESAILLPQNIITSVVPFSALDPEIVTTMILWETILKPKSNDCTVNDYQNLKAQWSNISKWQWSQSRSLREYISKVESSIEHSNIVTKLIKRMVFETLMSRMFFPCTFVLGTKNLTHSLLLQVWSRFFDDSF